MLTSWEQVENPTPFQGSGTWNAWFEKIDRAPQSRFLPLHPRHAAGKIPAGGELGLVCAYPAALRCPIRTQVSIFVYKNWPEMSLLFKKKKTKPSLNEHSSCVCLKSSLFPGLEKERRNSWNCTAKPPTLWLHSVSWRGKKEPAIVQAHLKGKKKNWKLRETRERERKLPQLTGDSTFMVSSTSTSYLLSVTFVTSCFVFVFWGQLGGLTEQTGACSSEGLSLACCSL